MGGADACPGARPGQPARLFPVRVERQRFYYVEWFSGWGGLSRQKRDRRRLAVTCLPHHAAGLRQIGEAKDRSPDEAPNRFMRFGAQSGIHRSSAVGPALRLAARRTRARLHAGYEAPLAHDGRIYDQRRITTKDQSTGLADAMHRIHNVPKIQNVRRDPFDSEVRTRV